MTLDTVIALYTLSNNVYIYLLIIHNGGIYYLE